MQIAARRIVDRGVPQVHRRVTAKHAEAASRRHPPAVGCVDGEALALTNGEIAKVDAVTRDSVGAI